MAFEHIGQTEDSPFQKACWNSSSTASFKLLKSDDLRFHTGLKSTLKSAYLGLKLALLGPLRIKIDPLSHARLQIPSHASN